MKALHRLVAAIEDGDSIEVIRRRHSVTDRTVMSNSTDTASTNAITGDTWSVKA